MAVLHGDAKGERSAHWLVAFLITDSHTLSAHQCLSCILSDILYHLLIFCLSWVFCARSIPLSPTPVSNIEDWTQQCCHLSTMELQPRPYNYLLSKSWKPRKTCEPSWKGEPLTNIKGYTVAFCYIVWNSGSSYWVVREGKNRSQLRDRWPWLFLLNCYFYYS